MGSPEPQNPNKFTATIIASTTEQQQSAAIIDSPIFKYINNLSPLTYTSKQIHTHQLSIVLESTESHISSLEDNNNTTNPNLENSSLKTSENSLAGMTDSANLDRSVEIFVSDDDNEMSCPEPVERNGKNSNCLQYNIRQNQRSVDQRYDQPLVAQVSQSQLGKRRRLQFEANIVKNNPHSQNPHNIAATSEVLESSMSKTTTRFSVNISKPSGIGLHLNSIVKAIPVSYPNGGGKKLVSVSSQMQDNIQHPSVSSNSNLVENVSATSEEYAHQTCYSNAESMKMVECQEKFDQGILNSNQVERVDAYVRSNPKKKRKKTDNSGDGCKNCNCKKTKCLKLYCDCFAAGIYCADSCSCQGCFNRPEFENTVLETRQQIESRDPLAFAPKIVPRSTQSPRMQILDDGDQVTPPVGRHKRGCNCKKSMCMKKYCECYQANVGCSEGCRCEGCQNIYGIKGVHSDIAMESVNEHAIDSFDDKKVKTGPIKSTNSLPEFSKPHNLAPQTPSFQCSTYAPSPESESHLYVTTTPKSCNDSIQIDQEIFPNGEFMDEFSPGDWSSTSRAQLPPPNRMRFSTLGSHGSSVTVTPVTLFGGAKSSFDITEDDSPNILKDPSTQQHNKVKVASSPNKKRVSPPRIRLHELGSSSLKSGRKFILKAVPSFPPLTPCFDSKQNSNHPPDNTL